MRVALRVVSVALAASLAGRAAHAETDAEAAKKLAEEGARALDVKHFQTALDRFRHAEVLNHTPSSALGLARAEAGLNRVVAARDAYTAIVSEGAPKDAPPADLRAVDDAKKELEQVVTRIAMITITVIGPDNPYVVLDDTPLPAASLGSKRATDPGQHTVRATARGYRLAETRFLVLEGGEVAAVLAMSQAPGGDGTQASFALDAPATSSAPPVPSPAESGASASRESVGPATPIASSVDAAEEAASREATASTMRAVAYVSFAVGGVGLITGIVAGLRASSQHSELASTCAPSCAASDVSRAQTAVDVSTAGYVTAIVGGAAGITLLLLAPKTADKPATAGIAPFVGIGYVGATGRF